MALALVLGLLLLLLLEPELGKRSDSKSEKKVEEKRRLGADYINTREEQLTLDFCSFDT
jgi:hypothetical protein